MDGKEVKALKHKYETDMTSHVAEKCAEFYDRTGFKISNVDVTFQQTFSLNESESQVVFTTITLDL